MQVFLGGPRGAAYGRANRKNTSILATMCDMGKNGRTATKLLSALSLLSCYLKSVGARELPWLLTVAPHVSVDYNADFFVEELGRLVETSRPQVAEVLVALLY
jgi:hypothetical protein